MTVEQHREHCRKYHIKHRAERLVYKRRWYKLNKQTIKAYKKSKIKETTARHRLQRYGLTQEQYDKMYMEQLGLCAACHEPFGKKIPVVDHNHKTGKVRGLLHHNCNCIVGYSKEDADKLRFVAEYIERHLDH